MLERELPSQEQRSKFFSKVPTLMDDDVFGERKIVGLYSRDFKMVIAANENELVKASYELNEGEFLRVGLEKVYWDGEVWSEDLFSNPQE